MTRILITGAAGMIGRALLTELTGQNVIATDLTNKSLPDGIEFHRMDVTRDDPDRVIAQVRPDVIVHLASIVTPPKGMGREGRFCRRCHGHAKRAHGRDQTRCAVDCGDKFGGGLRLSRRQPCAIA